MSAVSLIPTHEQEQLAQASAYLRAMPPAIAGRWEKAIAFFAEARIYDAYLEFNELLKDQSLGLISRTDIQLQAVRCLFDGPVDKINAELARIKPQNPYQQIVADYRQGFILRRREGRPEEAITYMTAVTEGARDVGSRAWECAALLELGHGMTQIGRSEEAVEHFTKVYNLSRRNGMLEYIPQALTGKGHALVRADQHAEGEELLHKALELATRNNLKVELVGVLQALALVYHKEFKYYGLALEYYTQALTAIEDVATWRSVNDRLTIGVKACKDELENIDIAKILGLMPLNKLRQDYLTSLVNGFVGIPGIDNRSQLGERIGLTRQAIHRNISGS